MQTELNNVEPQIVGGRKIDTWDYRVRNFRLHTVLEQASRLFLFLLECDSNNTNSKAIPSDVREIRAQFELMTSEFDFSTMEEHNDGVQASHENAYLIKIIDTKEIARVRNVKMKRIVTELFRSVQVITSVDSANTQAYIDPTDQARVRRTFATVLAAMDRWIGKGEGPADTGVYAPDFGILGEVIPDVDGDWAQTLEPSKSMPQPSLPDSPDTV